MCVCIVCLVVCYSIVNIVCKYCVIVMYSERVLVLGFSFAFVCGVCIWVCVLVLCYSIVG